VVEQDPKFLKNKYVFSKKFLSSYFRYKSLNFLFSIIGRSRTISIVIYEL
jgi:hypothetical protein